MIIFFGLALCSTISLIQASSIGSNQLDNGASVIKDRYLLDRSLNSDLQPTTSGHRSLKSMLEVGLEEEDEEYHRRKSSPTKRG